jgi:hypothetical protein
MDTGPKRSIFLELTERLGAQGQFRSGGALGSTCPTMKSLYDEESNIVSIAGLRDSRLHAAKLEDVRQTAEVGPSNYGLTPPLATLGSDYPPLLCTLYWS